MEKIQDLRSFSRTLTKGGEVLRGKGTNKESINKNHFKQFRPCLVGRKFSVFCIQTFRKQGKRV